MPPFAGTFHTSKPSDSSTALPSFDQPSGCVRRRDELVVIVRRVGEDGRNALRDRVLLARRDVERSTTARRRPSRAGCVPFGDANLRRRNVLLEQRLSLAGLEVDAIHIFISTAAVARVHVVLARVGAVREAIVADHVHVAQRVVRQPHELVVDDAILGQIVERAVLRLLDDLLRLEARILAVPEHERRILVRRSIDARLVDRAARAGRARLNDRLPAARVSDVAAVRRSLLRFADAEEHRREIVGDARRALGGDFHSRRKIGVLRRIEDDLLRRRKRQAREAHDREQRVARERVHLAAKHGERQSAVGPREASDRARDPNRSRERRPCADCEAARRSRSDRARRSCTRAIRRNRQSRTPRRCRR